MPQLPKPSDTIKSLNRSNSQVKYMLQFRKKKKTKTKRKKARQQTKKEKKTLSIDDTHSSPHGGREAAVTVELEHGSQVGAQEMDAVPHQLLGSLPQGNRSHSDNLPSGDGGGSGGGGGIRCWKQAGPAGDAAGWVVCVFFFLIWLLAMLLLG